MNTRTTLLMLGVGTAIAAPLIAKALRPLTAYAVAGGMIAYEAICDALEDSRDAVAEAVEEAREELNKKRRS